MMERQCEASTISDNEFQPPPDLTPHLVRVNNQYLVGGNFGDVYRCRYNGGSVPKEVAVKAFRFHFTLGGDEGSQSAKMLRRELGIWRRLAHDNIVPFLGIAYGFGMDGTMSLVSLWMPNESLHKFLAKYDNNMTVRHRLQLLLDIANGLMYLHSFPIVHGDLNSNNVLIDGDCTARLADFGYASLVGNIPEALAYLQRSTARPGALRWIAPEQVDPDETFIQTTKSDIYSFGCIALQVLSGKQPWLEVREDVAIVLRLAKGYNPGRPVTRAIDDVHWYLIQDCWSPMEDRPTAETIIRSLRHFLTSYPASRPLSDLLVSSSCQTVPDSDLPLIHLTPVEVATAYPTQTASREDDQNINALLPKGSELSNPTGHSNSNSDNLGQGPLIPQEQYPIDENGSDSFLRWLPLRKFWLSTPTTSGPLPNSALLQDPGVETNSLRTDDTIPPQVFLDTLPYHVPQGAFTLPASISDDDAEAESIPYYDAYYYSSSRNNYNFHTPRDSAVYPSWARDFYPSHSGLVKDTTTTRSTDDSIGPNEIVSTGMNVTGTCQHNPAVMSSPPSPRNVNRGQAAVRRRPNKTR